MIEWFVDLFEDCTKQGTKIKTDEYKEEGKYIIVDQGQNDIAGYTDEISGVYEDVPAIVFGDHTRVIKYIDKPFFLGADGVKLLKCKRKNANYKYLYYALKNAKIPNTGYNRHYKWLKEIKIMYPDPIRQQRIVDVLDKIEKIMLYKKNQIDKLDELIKARFVEMFGDPVYNEMGWRTKALENACKSIVDCPHSTPNYTSEDTGFMCIRTSIVKKNRIVWEEIEYIPEEEFNQRIQRKRPEKGDVIYTREGAILGIAAVIDRECNVALGQRSMLLSPDKAQCTPEFLSVAMNFDTFLNSALKGMSGSASPHINVGDIKAFQMILPPLEQQEAFSYFVVQVNKSKAAVQKSLDETQKLFDSLMQQYFG